jgi:hypothetical protein
MSFITSGVAVFLVTYAPAVTGLTASNPTVSTVDLAWTGSRGATGYSIVSTPTTTTQTTSGTSLTFTGLSSGTIYTFTVTSIGPVGPGGSTTSDPITTSTSGEPNAITNFTATFTSPGVRLDWIPPTNPVGILQYQANYYSVAYGFNVGFPLGTDTPPASLSFGFCNIGDTVRLRAVLNDYTSTPYVYATVS